MCLCEKSCQNILQIKYHIRTGLLCMCDITDITHYKNDWNFQAPMKRIPIYLWGKCVISDIKAPNDAGSLFEVQLL